MTRLTGAFRRIFVVPSATDRRRGFLRAGTLTVSCALGRGGIRLRKREGDGATPAGAWRMVAVYYRPDRVARPATALPVIPIRPDDGWCDDPADRAYNRPVRLPYAAGHERLWRPDATYDLVVVLDYNLPCPKRGAGSAIFLHLARPGLTPTAGCIAVTLAAMQKLLRQVDGHTRLAVA